MSEDFNFQTNLSEELRFLVNCCKIDPSDDDIKYILSYLHSSNLDISTLIRLAHQHGILPLVYKTIKNLSQNDYLNATRLTPNAEILIELKAHYISISQRNMMMSAELIHIMKLFKENGIEALAFKGPTLSQMAYGDITLRQFGDLDILIKRSDISLMVDLLMADGYIPQIELGTKMDEIFFNTLNVIGFYKSTSNILVEVHWELLSKNYAIKWNNNALWNQRKESTTINNHHIQVLSHEEHILYLCTHGSKHLFERLEWICDIDRSIRVHPNINWQNLLKESEKRGVKRMLCLGLALSEAFFELELPNMIRIQIEKDKALQKLISKTIEINFSETAQEGKDYSYFILIWYMREKLSDKLRFTWHAFFATQFNDFQFIKLPKYLAFLYPFVRQFRLIKKYILK